MIILPAIDLKDGKCVRLFQGDYATAEQVAEDPVKTAQSFEEQGARWVHLVDLDGAKARRPVNDSTVFSIRDNVSMNIEVGGGIRDMDTVEYYLSHGINRIILGSAALHSPEFVREAVKKYGKKIAVGIDALKGKVAAEGWTAKRWWSRTTFARCSPPRGCPSGRTPRRWPMCPTTGCTSRTSRCWAVSM